MPTYFEIRRTPLCRKVPAKLIVFHQSFRKWLIWQAGRSQTATIQTVRNNFTQRCITRCTVFVLFSLFRTNGHPSGNRIRARFLSKTVRQFVTIATHCAAVKFCVETTTATLSLWTSNAYNPFAPSNDHLFSIIQSKGFCQHSTVSYLFPQHNIRQTGSLSYFHALHSRSTEIAFQDIAALAHCLSLALFIIPT